MQKLPAADIPSMPIMWDGNSDIALGNAGQLVLSGSGLCLPQQQYTICFRQGGERCTPSNRNHSQTVKKLLQEFGLEVWLRDRVPLIYHENNLVAVGDLWVNKGYEPHPSEDSVCITWKNLVTR